jgi:hypothetical protein
MKAEENKSSTTDKAVESIKRQWNGGEHRLAGARASELLYGSGTKIDEKTFDQLREELPGIERYISAPAGGAVVETVSDQGGDPLATQPENRKEATGASNLSGDEAKSEQNAIDKKLEPGRKARAKAADQSSRPAKSNQSGKAGSSGTTGTTGAGDLVSTKLNPDPQNPESA